MSGNIGPLIFARQADVIREHLDEAVARGARIVAGGNIMDLGGGLYCEATVLTNTDHTMRVVMDETFGPIMPVMSFSTADEAVRLANDSIYGLSASVFSADRVEAEDIAARLNAGVVSINDASLSAAVHEVENEPFNCSGIGRSRMGPAGVGRYLRKKAILRNNYPALGLAAYSEPNA
jgi:succinate-semialdehyde dehydrogenase / glutarate-semialdehyde dehydrogenase